MKAYYGKNATAQNDFGYGWLPKLTGNHSFFEYLYDILDGKMDGMFLMGQNPAIGAPNARPNPAWLNFVVTGRARSKIRQWFARGRREATISFRRSTTSS